METKIETLKEFLSESGLTAEFIYNTKTQNHIHNFEKFFDEIKGYTETSIFNMLIISFDWSKTKEGNTFWKHHNKRWENWLKAKGVL